MPITLLGRLFYLSHVSLQVALVNRHKLLPRATSRHWSAFTFYQVFCWILLELKPQNFGHLMRRSDSLEKTQMLGKIFCFFCFCTNFPYSLCMFHALWNALARLPFPVGTSQWETLVQDRKVEIKTDRPRCLLILTLSIFPSYISAWQLFFIINLLIFDSNYSLCYFDKQQF